MEKHITLVGILNIVYSALSLIGAFALFAIAGCFRYIMDWVLRMNHEAMQEVPAEIINIVPIILGFIGAMILIASIVGIIGSIGVIKKKEWGRITLLVISFFHLISIPLGTILGVYSIWALLNDETIQQFNPAADAKSKKKTG
jgi:hypothetical protein